MNLEIVPYSSVYSDIWDSWCMASGNATFLHTRRFLNYHRERFDDASVLFFAENRLVGIMPAAKSLQDTTCVVSHPGATYGGIVHQGWLYGERIIGALFLLQKYYGSLGYRRFQYKPLPHIYAAIPSQDDLYALFRIGARRFRCDLSSAINLRIRRQPSERRRRGLKKAKKEVSISADKHLLKSFYNVLLDNLARKHDSVPVHSLQELECLMELFPDQIRLVAAMIAGEVEAGVILFNSRNVWHAQYIASSKKGYAVSALDAVFDAAITEAQNAGATYFDFGTSNEENGQVLNAGLYQFKSEFGGGGIAYEHYEMTLI